MKRNILSCVAAIVLTATAIVSYGVGMSPDIRSPEVTSKGEVLAPRPRDDAVKKETDVWHKPTKNPPDSDCRVAFFRGHEYWFCRINRSFDEAHNRCTRQQMNLVRIDDYAENEFVHEGIAFDSWIGASDSAHQGDWRWATGEELFWTGGARGEPIGVAFQNWNRWRFDDDPDRHCAVIDKSEGEWNNLNCKWQKDYVCEGSLFGEGEKPVPGSRCQPEIHDGHVYWFCEDNRSFKQARHHCQAVDADLVVVDDERENAFISGHIKTDSFIGLSDAERDGIWRWVADNRLGWCAVDASEPPAASSFANWGTAQGTPFPRMNCDRKTFNNRSYLFCEDHTPWHMAEPACRSFGMSLARVDDQKEFDFLRLNLGRPSWLGATDATTEGQWRWVGENRPFWTGGPEGRPVSGAFAVWERGEPNGGRRENCLSIENRAEGFRDTGCSVPLGRVCEAPETVALERPDANDCAVVVEGLGRWHNTPCEQPAGYVCETKTANAGLTLKELARWVRHDIQTGQERVNYVEFRDQSLVTDPFLRYSRDLGLRECVDSLDPVGEPRDLPHKGLDQITYQQHYKGLPVYNTGFGVQRDPTTGAVVSMTGSVVHDMEVDPVPSIREEEAFQIAVNRIGGNPDDYMPRARGELVIIPTRYGPKSDWELAWLYSLEPTGKIDGYTVAVSAKNGEIVLSVPLRRPQCTSTRTNVLQPQDMQRVTLDINAFQQILFGDPNTATSTRLVQPGLDDPYVLYTQGLEPLDPYLAATPTLLQAPLIVASCPGEAQPLAITLETSNLNEVDASSPDNHLGALAYMSVQRCLEHIAASFEKETSTGAVPWVGYDGLGESDIEIRLFNDPTLPDAHYNPSDDTINISVDALRDGGASIDWICHELTHGLFELLNVIDDFPNRALEEGFADIVGNTAEMRFRGYPGPGAVPSGWCFGGDESNNDECLRNFVDPWPYPQDYSDPDTYCRYPEICDGTTMDCCTVHHNSTVLSHWFYMVTSGNISTESGQCPDTVQPLHTDLETSVSMGLDILFRGLQEYYAGSAQGGFPDLADATIYVAREFYGLSEFQTIIDGWYAANVRENFDEIRSALVEPRRGEENVYPWKTFIWPAFGDETSWDIELKPSEEGTGDFVSTWRDGIGNEVLRDGQRFGTFDFALPPDFDHRIYWRVRPHHEDPEWEDCYPWHWFDSVGMVEDVENVEVVDEFDPNLQVRPGTVRFRWDPVDGAREYRIHLATRNTNCIVGEDVLEVTEEPRSDEDGKLVTWVAGVQPNETYWIQIQPVGPEDPSGDPPLGSCATHEFTTTSMRPPVLLYPRRKWEPWPKALFKYQSPHYAFYPVNLGLPVEILHFKWRGLDGPTEYSVHFYLRDQDGNCDQSPFHVEIVDEPCRSPEDNDGCIAQLDKDVFPVPHPTGYCWDVVSVAANAETIASSEMREVEYYLLNAKLVQPGVYEHYQQYHRPAPLVGADGSLDTWGQDVTFEWEPVANAAGYMFKLGRWPWLTPVAPRDPPNCGSSRYCDYEPSEVVHRLESVTGISITLNDAAYGRYCWTVWPLLEDPDEPGTVAEGQPGDVWVSTPFCYTSGPAEPIIEVDWPSTTGFSSDPIHGTITLPYVPDHQLELTVSPEEHFDIDLHFETYCEEIEQPYFRDLTGCVLPFTIFPEEGQIYQIEVHTYNSSEVDPATYQPLLVTERGFTYEVGTYRPRMEEAYEVHRVVEEFTMGTCGQQDEPCCDGSTCDSGFICDSGTCECGGRNQPCCPGNDCDSGFVCESGTCQDCGGSGQPCCEGSTCDSSSYECRGGTCQRRLPDLQITYCDNPEIKNVGSAPTPTRFTITESKECWDGQFNYTWTMDYDCPTTLGVGESIWLSDCTELGSGWCSMEVGDVEIYEVKTPLFDESDNTNNIIYCWW